MGIGVLQEDSRILPGRKVTFTNWSNNDFIVKGLHSCLNHGNCLRVQTIGQVNLGSLVVANAKAHRLSGSGTFVKQGCIGNVQSSQLRDERLVVQQRLQASLGNLRLIRSVLSSPARVLEYIPENRVRDVAVVIAHADVRPPDLVLLGNVPNPVDQRVLVWEGGQQNIIIIVPGIMPASLGVHMEALGY